MKVCSKCGVGKAESEFYAHKTKGLKPHCKRCHNKGTVEGSRKRKAKDPETFSQKRLAWARSRKEELTPIKAIQCLECGTPVNIYSASRLERTKFCSPSCRSTHHGRINPGRIKAMLEAITPDIEAVRLSRMKRGKDHHAWIDGRSSKQRPKAAVSKWRKAVFDRDDYTCQRCFVRGGKLHADHILPYATHVEMRWVVSNGRTLCVGCHKLTPTYGAKLSKLLRGNDMDPEFGFRCLEESA